MPLLKTPAIVLKSRKWGDADRIVTFFTLKHGKVRGVARGARRMKSRFGGTLEPFVYCDLVLYEKPGDSLYRVSDRRPGGLPSAPELPRDDRRRGAAGQLGG